MKKINLLYLLSLICTLFLASCINDDSTSGTDSVSNITISNVNDSYSIISYAGNKLEIQPTIETGYSDMEYNWYVIDKSKEGKNSLAGASQSDYEMESIANTKDLSYEVNLAEGQYIIVLKAKSKLNNYSIYKTAKLEVTTQFSRGFYILKETTDGKTDLDMYTSKNLLLTDILAKTQGAAMAGTPRAISPCYSQCFLIDQTKAYGNCISVTTNANELKFFRVSDMKCVIDKSNLSYGTTPATEQFYNAFRGYFTIYTFSNKGVRNAYTSDASNGTGKFSDALGNPASPFIVTSGSFYGPVYWDEVNHGFGATDFNGYGSEVTATNGTNLKVSGLTDYTCIACGESNIANNEKLFFILQNTAGQRFLYKLAGSFNGVELYARTELSGELNMSKSKLFTVNGRDATLIYCVNNNKLYGYNFETGTEKELTLTDIPSSEQIAYISNQYWKGLSDGDYHYNYLMIGTQNGNTYKLYFYEMVGGQPNGKPVKTITGTGKIKSVRYMTPNFRMGDSFNCPNQD